MILARINAAALWHDYTLCRTLGLRNRLVEAYLPLVKMHAMNLARSLPAAVDKDDMASAGAIGLVQAVERFDPTCGTRFETYSAARIQYAMIDGLRHDNCQRRSTPEPPKVSIETTIDPKRVIGDLLADPYAADDMADLLHRDGVARLLELLGPLDRAVVDWYYLRGRTMREIAAALGYCESAISQRLARAMARLRHLVGGRAEDF